MHLDVSEIQGNVELLDALNNQGIVLLPGEGITTTSTTTSFPFFNFTLPPDFVIDLSGLFTWPWIGK